MLRIPSPFGEDFNFYERTWGIANYENKTVLDIGADVGSTADYFLQKGAKKVIAVEGSEYYWSKLCDNCLNYKFSFFHVEPVLLNIKSPEDYKYLIQKYLPDIVKIDCEGCEVHLLDLDKDTVKLVREYIIEVHSTELVEKFKAFFRGCNYSIIQEIFHPGNSSVKIILWARND
ncbi:MAG: hypothetical protein QXK24_00200 [Ignisphaera sp.]